MNIIDQTKDLFIQGGMKEENMYQGARDHLILQILGSNGKIAWKFILESRKAGEGGKGLVCLRRMFPQTQVKNDERMIDTCCLLGTNTSFCLYFSEMDFKMRVTDVYSKVLIFIDLRIS